MTNTLVSAEAALDEYILGNVPQCMTWRTVWTIGIRDVETGGVLLHSGVKISNQGSGEPFILAPTALVRRRRMRKSDWEGCCGRAVPRFQ